MSYRKSDLLALGCNRHESPGGDLIVSFHSKPGSGDMLMLREVLALFDASIINVGAGYISSGTHVSLNHNLTGYVTDLKFAELAKLNLADSFPAMEEKRIAAKKAEQDRHNSIKARELAEQEIHGRRIGV